MTLYLNGLGITNPPLSTGAINPLTPIPLSLTVKGFLNGSLNPVILSATTSPGVISSVWEVQIQVPADGRTYFTVDLEVDGVPLSDTRLVIWKKKSTQ